MTSTNTPKKTQTRIARRRAKVATMYIRGMTQHQIAEHVGFSQGTVCSDLAAVREVWKDRMASTFDEHVSQQLATIDELERVAWAAYEQSRRPPDKVTRKKKRIIGGDTFETSRERLESFDDADLLEGNPRFFAEIGKCVDRRCRILGLNKQDDLITSTHVDIVEIEVTTREDAQKILSMAEFEAMGGHIDHTPARATGPQTDVQGLTEAVPIGQNGSQKPATAPGKTGTGQSGHPIGNADGHHGGNGNGIPLPGGQAGLKSSGGSSPPGVSGRGANGNGKA